MEDARAVYEVFERAIADLERRAGVAEADNMWMDPAAVAEYWERRRPLFEHLARTANRPRQPPGTLRTGSRRQQRPRPHCSRIDTRPVPVLAVHPGPVP